MRFLAYTLGDETQPMPEPDPEMYATMDKFVAEAMGSGVIVATGGIGPSAMGAKVSLTDGEFTVVDGPFAETKELVGGWALIEVKDKDEAVEWTKRFLRVVGFGESRLRPVFGPE